MPSVSHNERKERQNASRRAYYERNLEKERTSSCLRARKTKEAMSTCAEQKEQHALQHQVAQAQYRDANRDLINLRKREHRLRKKQEAARAEDKALFQKLWGQGEKDTADQTHV
ncbi:hypothetical protein CPC08DRAFT_727110 [Agrocybe pediades]|nr:hypothetical protein CPC08DRAFT_727110 [Agrocybe pediades]